MTDQLLVPRQYQLEDARFLASRRGAILASSMGTGKTGVAILAWKALSMKGPLLVVARPNTQSVWLKQAPRWGIQVPYIISGTKKQRLKEWGEVDEFSVVMSTLECVRQDIDQASRIKWFMVILEEAHKINNRKTAGFKTFRSLQRAHTILITGTPMKRSFADLWALLNICDHKRWTSYWRFVHTFGITQLNEQGAWEVLGIRDRSTLRNAIDPYYIRRTMDEVAPEVPQKNHILEHVLRCTPHQQELYEEMISEGTATLRSKGILLAPTILARITRLRQILCTPKLIDPDSDWGALLEHFKELLEDDDTPSRVLFTPFAQAIPIIKEFLKQECQEQDEQIFSLQGGTKAEVVNEIIDKWRASGGTLICTIDFAESFDLVPASWAYFVGFSFSPMQNVQAEDRLRRLITTYPTYYYYPTHEGCIDKELVLEACELKASEILKVYGNGQNPAALLKQKLNLEGYTP